MHLAENNYLPCHLNLILAAASDFSIGAKAVSRTEPKPKATATAFQINQTIIFAPKEELCNRMHGYNSLSKINVNKLSIKGFYNLKI